MPPRRLTFAVSTGLLTASLAAGTVGCKEQPQTVNPMDTPVNPGPEAEAEETVNTVPSPEPGDEGGDEPKPADDVHVNTVPDDASAPE